jgi:hypothetical protein
VRIEPGELEQSHRVEQLRRSVVMLPPGAPALNRDEAAAVLGALVEALLEVRRLRDERG